MKNETKQISGPRLREETKLKHLLRVNTCSITSNSACNYKKSKKFTLFSYRIDYSSFSSLLATS